MATVKNQGKLFNETFTLISPTLYVFNFRPVLHASKRVVN